MSKHARDNRPYIKPVTRIELSGDRSTLRLILIVVLLAIACVSVFIGVGSAIKVEPGWQEAEVSSKKVNCSQEFTLMYDFSDYNVSDSTDELKKVNALYTTLTEDAYAIFTASEFETEFANVRYLNDHVNEMVTVDPALYKALEQIVHYDSRYPYLAPVYEEYDRVFAQTNEVDAARFDPSKNPELMDYIRHAASYANDKTMVWLELFGTNQVTLHVSDEYLDFAEYYELDTFFDLHWMTNAFIIDYMADRLAGNGYTSGYLASYDGFNRNLDQRGLSYSHNVYDRLDNEIYLPVVYNYQGPTAIVVLKNYSMSDAERWHYFSYSDGTITTTFIDPVDGAFKSATDNIFVYGAGMGCAEILLQSAPAFISNEMNEDALMELSNRGIYSIWAEETNLYCTDVEANLTQRMENGGDQYTVIVK